MFRVYALKCGATSKKDWVETITESVMEETPESNYDFEPPDIFSVFNNYLLLFFGASSILGYVLIQQLFVTLDQLQLGILVSPILGIMLPVYIITRRFPGGFKEQLLVRRPRTSLALYVFLATLAVVVIVDHIYLLSLRFMPPSTDYLEGLMKIKPTHPMSIVVTYLGLGVVAPVGEEVIFRGIIQRVFGRNMRGVLAVVLAGLFFGIMHLAPTLLPSMFVFGVFLGYLFFATSNLTYPILAHCTFNTVAYLQLVMASNGQMASVPFYPNSYWALGGSLVAVSYLLLRINKGALDVSKAPQNNLDSSKSD